jgi:hypothetical protein
MHRAREIDRSTQQAFELSLRRAQKCFARVKLTFLLSLLRARCTVVAFEPMRTTVTRELARAAVSYARVDHRQRATSLANACVRRT